MPMSGFYIQLERGCWLAPWTGDPGRTMVEASAKRFPSRQSAERALGQARRFRPFSNAVILSSAPASAWA